MSSVTDPSNIRSHSDAHLNSLADERNPLNVLETILLTVPVALIIIDAKGQIITFSASAEKLFGYSGSDMIGQNIKHLMGGDDAQYHDSYISNYINTGEAQIIGVGRIVQAKRSDNTLFPVHLTIGETKVGGELLFVGYVRDLTDQQAQSHRLTQLQTELASFARLSTAGTMASAMAHELNQPLTAIANYLEAARDMLDAPSSETQPLLQEALDAAAKQSIRAGQIVRKLRDFVSRGEFETRPSDINELVHEAVSLLKLGIEGETPRVILRIPDDTLLVLIDRIQIRQVLLNLMRNAHDALHNTDQPTIWVDVHPQKNSQIVIKVRDNGPGLALEKGRSPFEPFQSSKSSGMGLGLSICQSIIEAHDGKIWVEENPDEAGTVFSFTLNAA